MLEHLLPIHMQVHLQVQIPMLELHLPEQTHMLVPLNILVHLHLPVPNHIRGKFPILRNPICLCLMVIHLLPNKVPTRTPNKVIILHLLHLKDTPQPTGTHLKVHPLLRVNSLIILLLKTLKIPRNGVEEFSLVISDTEIFGLY